jgi:hypothetical protein
MISVEFAVEMDTNACVLFLQSFPPYKLPTLIAIQAVILHRGWTPFRINPDKRLLSVMEQLLKQILTWEFRLLQALSKDTLMAQPLATATEITQIFTWELLELLITPTIATATPKICVQMILQRCTLESAVADFPTLLIPIREKSVADAIMSQKPLVKSVANASPSSWQLPQIPPPKKEVCWPPFLSMWPITAPLQPLILSLAEVDLSEFLPLMVPLTVGTLGVTVSATQTPIQILLIPMGLSLLPPMVQILPMEQQSLSPSLWMVIIPKPHNLHWWGILPIFGNHLPFTKTPLATAIAIQLVLWATVTLLVAHNAGMIPPERGIGVLPLDLWAALISSQK